MKNKLLFLYSCLFFMLGACSDNMHENIDTMGSTTDASETSINSGLIRIKIKREANNKLQIQTRNGTISTGFEQLDSISKQLNISRIERSFAYGGEHEWKQQELGLDLWYDVYFDESFPITRSLQALSAVAEVEIAEPDFKITRTGGSIPIVLNTTDLHISPSSISPFNDSLFSLQWHYYNDGSLPYSINGADIDLLPAWQVTAGHPDVIVAIVDGGIQTNHEDLSDNMWTSDKYQYGWNFVDKSPTIIPHDHGTHVAGTIAAVNNNKKGISGIAGGTGTTKGVQLMSCQIFKPNPSNPNEDIGSNLVHEAIRFGADNGAVISQNSWGYLWDKKPQTTPPPLSAIHKDAIDYFIQYAGTDKSGKQVGPMKGGLVIFAAGNEDTEHPSYPGAYEKVLAVSAFKPDFKKAYYSNYGDWVDLSAPGGEYFYGSKEHMVLSTLTKNGYGYMQGTSMACPHVSGIAALIISKLGVNNPGLTPDDVKEILLHSCKDINIYNGIYQGKLGVGYINAGLALQENTGTPPKEVDDLEITWLANTMKLRWSVTDDGNNGKAFRYDIYLSKNPLASDNDLLSLEAKAQVKVGNKKVGDILETIITDIEPATAYYIAIRGVDIFGNGSKATFNNGETTENHAPEKKKNIENMYFDKIGTTQQLNLDDYFYDQDEEILEYTITSNINGLIQATIQDANILSITGLKSGQAEICITASDFLKEFTTATFTILVRDGSQEIDLYPNPVKDILNIRIGEEEQQTVKVSLYNSAGIKSLDTEISISRYKPGQVNLSKLPGGVYSIVIKFQSKEITRNIIKL